MGQFLILFIMLVCGFLLFELFLHLISTSKKAVTIFKTCMVLCLIFGCMYLYNPIKMDLLCQHTSKQILSYINKL